VELGSEFRLRLRRADGEEVFAPNILTVGADGTLYRHPSINKDAARAVGLQLDSRGRILLDTEVD
ncbi:MAG TPA: hypothetical protein VGK43_06775, partial [Solirubrobacterales bacterium]